MFTTKSYTYATSGLVLGALVSLILHDVLDLPDGLLFYVWLIMVSAAGGAGGFVVSMLEPDSQRQEAVKSKKRNTGETSISTTMRFFAIADKTSSELKPIQVTFAKPSFSPPDMELELLIDSYSDTARCNVIEGVLQKLPFPDLAERIVTEANNRVPKNAKNADLELVSFRSEGPIQTNGCCAEGWSFELVDKRLGLGASVISTHSGLSIRYQTVVTHIKPSSEEVPDLPEALDRVRTQLPELEQVPLYARATMSDELLVFPQGAPFLVDVSPETGRVRNESAIRDMIANWLATRDETESFALADIFAWSAGETPEDGDFARAVSDEAFADKLRTFDPEAMRRVGRAIFAESGPGVVRELERRAMDPVDGNDPKMEIELLAHIPSGLAIAALHDLLATAPEDIARTEAEHLFAEFRSGERRLDIDPVASMDFISSRRLMGKTHRRVVPLRSTFAIEEEILAPLVDEIGLCAMQRRVLSGDSQMTLEVYLRPDRGDTEALVVSAPLPVPCYILHLVGSAADTFAERTEKAGLTYGRGTMLSDLRSTVPTRVHRAALYLASLQEGSPDGAEALIEAYRKGRADRNLRRAVMCALTYTVGASSRDFLQERADDEDHDDHKFARLQLATRTEAGIADSKKPARSNDAAGESKSKTPA